MVALILDTRFKDLKIGWTQTLAQCVGPECSEGDAQKTKYCTERKKEPRHAYIMVLVLSNEMGRIAHPAHLTCLLAAN